VEAVEKGHMTIVEVLLKAGAIADHKVYIPLSASLCLCYLLTTTLSP